MNSDDFDAYSKLFDEYLDRAIRWSEAGVLAPFYLHLHENDIGLGGGTEYRHWHYLNGFVSTLEPLIQKFDSAVFCYSLEENSPCTPSDAKRSKFFYYEFETKTKQTKAKRFTRGRVDASKRPKEELIRPGLVSALERSDYIQPYILQFDESGDEGDVVHQSRLIEGSRAAAEALANHFADTSGCYQFSIYGYKLKEGASLNRVERMLLRQAFINHIHAWNHDLRGINFIHGAFRAKMGDLVTQLPLLEERLRESQRQIGTVTAQLSGSLGSRAEIFESVLPVDEGACKRVFLLPHTPLEILRRPALVEDFFKRVRTEATFGFTAFGRFIELAGAAKLSALPSILSNSKDAEWGASIFLAAKLLSRELRGAPQNGMWPDQVIVNILYWLAQSGRDDIPLSVSYTIGTEEDPTDEQFKKRVLIAPTGSSDELWSSSKWVLQREANTATASWTYPVQGATGSFANALEYGVRSGLLRAEDKIQRDLHPYTLRLPGKRPNAQAYQEFLANMGHVVLKFATEVGRGSRSVPMATLNKIELLYKQWRGNSGSGSARLSLRLICSGQLSDDFAKRIGTFSTGIKGICRAFGQTRPIRARQPDCSGFFYEPSETDGCVFSIILDSDGE